MFSFAPEQLRLILRILWVSLFVCVFLTLHDFISWPKAKASCKPHINIVECLEAKRKNLHWSSACHFKGAKPVNSAVTDVPHQDRSSRTGKTEACSNKQRLKLDLRWQPNLRGLRAALSGNQKTLGKISTQKRWWAWRHTMHGCDAATLTRSFLASTLMSVWHQDLLQFMKDDKFVLDYLLFRLKNLPPVTWRVWTNSVGSVIQSRVHFLDELDASILTRKPCETRELNRPTVGTQWRLDAKYIIETEEEEDKSSE